MNTTFLRHSKARIIGSFRCLSPALAAGILTVGMGGFAAPTTLFAQVAPPPAETAAGKPAVADDRVRDADLGSTPNSHAVGDLYLAGQFEKEDLEKIQAQGINRVISLRDEGEIDWDEKELVEAAGLEYISIPISGIDGFSDEVFGEIRKLLGNDQPTLMHCGSGVRVAIAWLPFRVLDEGVKLESALEEAQELGLRERFVQSAVDYIEREQEKVADGSKMKLLESVKPGINESFLNPELDVDQYIERFEVESREVYSAREEVLEACGVKPGAKIADVGAGTGIYTRLFSRAVGPEGWIFAVDIAPRFIQHINASARELKLPNITGVICAEDSINLPPESVDMVFVCDTYHHFEYPQQTLASINSALKPGGTFVVIDFERIPGTTREWTLNHVRAGKEVFRSEVEAAGFEFVEEIDIEGFQENYFLKFRKP